MEQFTHRYEALKGNRTLHWRPHLGFVDIVLELKDGKKLNVCVSPVHVAIIKMFENQVAYLPLFLASLCKFQTFVSRYTVYVKLWTGVD